MIFIRVDFPAPFSPRTPWMDPGATIKEIRSLATIPGYVLVMSRNSSRGGSSDLDISVLSAGTGQGSLQDVGKGAVGQIASPVPLYSLHCGRTVPMPRRAIGADMNGKTPVLAVCGT